jgi:hypothetical protein
VKRVRTLRLLSEPAFGSRAGVIPLTAFLQPPRAKAYPIQLGRPYTGGSGPRPAPTGHPMRQGRVTNWPRNPRADGVSSRQVLSVARQAESPVTVSET